MRPRLFLALLATVVFTAACEAQSDVLLEDAFPNLSFVQPVELMDAGDGSGLLYVAEQTGRLLVFENDPDVPSASTFLDIRGQVSFGGEAGLLGLAFDPDYATNRYFYLNYTVGGPLRTRISRFTRSSTNPLEADPASELILLEVSQPFSNHNAGAIDFGPAEGPGGERYLYVGLGDGGSAGDPQENGQNLGTLLGSMLRLDVNGGGNPLDCATGTGSATIPPDNPFIGQAGACDEAWAYGLRNPWRIRFDDETGTLWVGDVGQGSREEVLNVGVGENHGWNEYEGTLCFDGPCDPTGKTFPVYEYSHTSGRISITGGYVYRGSAIPDLVGQYIYGDLNGLTYALDTSGASPVNTSLPRFQGPGACSFGYCLTSFGEDAEGELYLMGAAGAILKLVPDGTVASEPPPDAVAFSVGPNPVAGTAVARFATTGTTRLTLHDALGRLVAVVFDGSGRGTPQEAAVATDALAPGVYTLRLSSDAGTAVQKLTVAR